MFCCSGCAEISCNDGRGGQPRVGARHHGDPQGRVQEGEGAQGRHQVRADMVHGDTQLKLNLNRYGKYQHGDSDLARIKRISLEIREEQGGFSGGGGGNSSNSRQDRQHDTETIATGQFREGLTNHKHIEKVYLTGIYKDKYKQVINSEC